MTDNATLAILIVLGLVAAALVRQIRREYAASHRFCCEMERADAISRTLAARGGK